LVIFVPVEELALAVVFMMKNVQQSRPYEAFFRYVIMASGKLAIW
jgi:hypothetical protein